MKTALFATLLLSAAVWWTGMADLTVPRCDQKDCQCTPPNIESFDVYETKEVNGNYCYCLCGKTLGKECNTEGTCAKCLICMAGCDNPSTSIGVCKEKVSEYINCTQYQEPICKEETNYEVQCVNRVFQCSDEYINGFSAKNSQGDVETFQNECQFYMRNLEVDDKFIKITNELS